MGLAYVLRYWSQQGHRGTLPVEGWSDLNSACCAAMLFVDDVAAMGCVATVTRATRKQTCCPQGLLPDWAYIKGVVIEKPRRCPVFDPKHAWLHGWLHSGAQPVAKRHLRILLPYTANKVQ